MMFDMYISILGRMVKQISLTTKDKVLSFIKPLLLTGIKIGILLLAVIFLFMAPAYSFADTVSSVDQVLGTIAEVVKDRAKTVATEAIIDRLTSELCGDDEKIKENKDEEKKVLVVDKEGIQRNFFLGGKQECRKDSAKCDSDDLFLKTCRIFKNEPNMQLTDPYFLKTLSRDTVGFAVRLSAYKLNDEQFKSLNLEPFTNFIHAVMEQLAKGKTDVGAFSSQVDELANQYSKTDKIYIEILNEIKPQLDELNIAVNGLMSADRLTFSDKIKKIVLVEMIKEAMKRDNASDDEIDGLVKTLATLDAIKDEASRYISKDDIDKKIKAVTNLMTVPNEGSNLKERWDQNDEIFKKLFGYGKPFSKALASKCSDSGLVNEDLIKTCRQAQLTFRLQDMIYRVKFDIARNEKGKIARFLHTIDESDVYKDAAAIGDKEKEFIEKYQIFSNTILTLLKNGPSSFPESEFKKSENIKNLYEALVSDKLITATQEAPAIQDLNKILLRNDLYKQIKSNKAKIAADNEIVNLERQLNTNKEVIKRLNRIAIELAYPNVTTKSLNGLKDGTFTHAAIADTLSLTAAVAQALTHEPDYAIKWLKQFQNDLRFPSSINSLKDLKSIPSLDWFKRESLPYYTVKMRDAFVQMLFSPQIYLYSLKDDNSRDIELIRNFAIQMSSATAMITSINADKPSIAVAASQLAEFVKVISKNMPANNMPEDGEKRLKQFADALKSISVILEHASERDWVAIGFDINDQLRDYGNKNIEFQRGLQFSRVLLSMYQASSVEEAKGIFQATLENEASRKQRYDQGNNWAVDVAALVGLRAGYVEQRWDKSSTNDDNNGFGHGVYAPFGVQFAKKEVGILIYPIDLGGYLSGSLADKTAEIRVHSALHTGVAVYCRPWKKTPVVFGIGGDYKPRFSNDDSAGIRASGFIALELPLFIIK